VHFVITGYLFSFIVEQKAGGSDLVWIFRCQWYGAAGYPYLMALGQLAQEGLERAVASFLFDLQVVFVFLTHEGEVFR